MFALGGHAGFSSLGTKTLDLASERLGAILTGEHDAVHGVRYVRGTTAALLPAGDRGIPAVFNVPSVAERAAHGGVIAGAAAEFLAGDLMSAL